MSTAEEILLHRAHNFDLESLGEIYDTYSPRVYRYAVRLLGDPDLAEECVSETFQRFLVALKNGGGPQDHLQAYLYRIAHNWITDQYRRQPPVLELSEYLSDENANPAQHALDRIDQSLVRSALMRLTPDQRQVIILRFLEGWDNEETARIMDKPYGAIKALQHRALETLKRLLLSEKPPDNERSGTFPNAGAEQHPWGGRMDTDENIAENREGRV
jgi:RNA polymerase sigma-70 factor, ECF subfamily